VDCTGTALALLFVAIFLALGAWWLLPAIVALALVEGPTGSGVRMNLDHIAQNSPRGCRDFFSAMKLPSGRCSDRAEVSAKIRMAMTLSRST